MENKLEDLWKGKFGDDYTNRNDHRSRQKFWDWVVKTYLPKYSSVLELGCNRGLNLECIYQANKKLSITGCDVNEKAIKLAREAVPTGSYFVSSASDLPLVKKRTMVITCGLLIHMDDVEMIKTLNEIHRLSEKYVLIMEYYADQKVDIPYRGHSGALFKRPYYTIFKKLFPEYSLEVSGLLTQGFDNVTYWVLEK